MKKQLCRLFKYLSNGWKPNDCIEKIEEGHPNYVQWPSNWWFSGKPLHCKFYSEVKKRKLTID